MVMLLQLDFIIVVLDINNNIILQYGFIRNVGSGVRVYFPLIYPTWCTSVVFSSINNTTTIGDRALNSFQITCINNTNVDYMSIGF